MGQMVLHGDEAPRKESAMSTNSQLHIKVALGRFILPLTASGLYSLRSSTAGPSRSLRGRNFLPGRSAHSPLLSRRDSFPWWPTEEIAKLAVEPLDLFFNRGCTLQLLWCEIEYVHVSSTYSLRSISPYYTHGLACVVDKRYGSI
jgi:hypothetical protein